MTLFARICMTLLATTVACTKPNPAATCINGACLDAAFPFCDVNGAVGGTPNQCLGVSCTPGEFEACDGSTALTCNVAGDNFDEVVCGAGCEGATGGCLPFCTPDEVLGCTDGAISVCNTEGTAATVGTTCLLGCASDEVRCLSFEPSNGLGLALTESASEADLVLPEGAEIDTDQLDVRDANGVPIAVKIGLVTQVGAPPIMTIEARSISISSLTVTGTLPLAIVSDGKVVIAGRVTARASGRIRGPGSRLEGTCSGQDARQFVGLCPQPHSVGAGGGASHTAGGRGGASLQNGGVASAPFTPLVGGCPGGSQITVDGASFVGFGGGGGGAIQIVSATKIELTDLGLIDVGGGGGASTAGGGAGGTVVIEAPEVAILGELAGVAANGGGGGGCGQAGADGLPSGALGRVCANYFSGAGGTGSNAPGNGCVTGCDGSVCPVVYGGGGGSVGVLRIATRDGTFTSGSPFLSVAVTAAALTTK